MPQKDLDPVLPVLPEKNKPMPVDLTKTRTKKGRQIKDIVEEVQPLIATKALLEVGVGLLEVGVGVVPKITNLELSPPQH